ncbi:MAG TPA: glycosyltransferase family 39 protein [Acidobacteriaceae bacterium]|nr:glycosyltransferase family 39 protein [Acidobacteriaceae bacterium]
MTRASRFALAPVAVFLACFFEFAACHRLIDGDEGFYLLASRLVMEHRTPYFDFFYTQAPLVPYAYGLWMWLFRISWFSARSFSALLTAILGVLIYEHVCHETRKWAAGAAAVILFASSTLIFAWFPLVKTYSLAALFLVGAYVIVTRLSPASSPWMAAVAGLLFGLGVDTRSYVVGLAPVFLWWVLRHSGTGNRNTRVLWFLGGFTVGIVPCLILFASSPSLFLFNNLGYHAIRSNAGLIGDWRGKFVTGLMVLFGRANGVQFAILSAVSLVVIFATRMRKGGALLAFAIAFVLGFISILPTPPMVQYFCMCMPFLIVGVVCGASDFIASQRSGSPKRIAVLVSVIVVVTFVVASAPGFRRYLFTGDRVVGIKNTDDARNWTLANASAVSRAIDELAAPKEQIASFWPGYVAASKAEPSPGFENDFGWVIANKLTSDQRAKYHIITRSEIEADFAAHTPRIIVLGNQWNGGFSDASEWVSILRKDDYVEVRTIGDTSIFVCCSKR